MSEERAEIETADLSRWLVLLLASSCSGSALVLLACAAHRAGGASGAVGGGAVSQTTVDQPGPADAPRRQRARVSRRRHRARDRRVDRPGLAQAAVAIRVDGEVRDLMFPIRARRARSRSSPRGTPRRSTCCATRRRTSWPRRCASSSRRRASASVRRSTTASTTTSRSPRPFTPEDLEQIEARMAEVTEAGLSVRARGGGPRRGQPALRRRPAQARADQRAGRTTRSSPPTPTVRSPTSAAGPHVPEHRPAQALQAAHHRRRLLARRRRAARCCSASTARPSSRRTSSTRTCTGSRRRGSATTACSARSSTSSCSTRSRRAPPFWTDQGHDDLQRCSTRSCASCSATGYQEIKTPLLYNKGLWEISGHWGKYKENMFLVLDNETGEHDMSRSSR